MGLRNTDLRVRPARLFATAHEGDHSRQIRLVRQHLQVVEQLHVRFEAVWNAGRLIHVGPLSGALLFGLLDPSFLVPK